VKTVLFAWELGHGLGHLMSFRRIAARLKPHGIRIVAAVREPASAGVLRGIADEIVKAPAWPADLRTGMQRPAGSSATLNDVLSEAGLADGPAVQRLLAEWDGIFGTTRPGLIVADFSPLAALAARDRIPLILIGNGYTLPPHEMQRFPKLHRHSPPVWSEEQTLETVNTAVQSRGWKPLTRLPQLFEGDVNLVQTFPLLDPYDTQRPDNAGGPLLEYEPAPANADAHTVFVYLSGGYAPHPSVFEALMPLAQRVRIHAPAMAATHQQSLREAGARLDTKPPPLADVLPSTRLVIHSGGSGVAAEALACGAPQIVLSAQIEQDLNGEALQRAGVARLVRTHVPGAKIETALVRSAAEDQAMAGRAAALGRRHRKYLKSNDALSKCEATCLRWLR
jgi:UDP:flavonoid glycosyltransferase YjiC (YdhE family)